MQLAMKAKAQAHELQRRAALEPRLEKELCIGPTPPAVKQQARQQYEPGKSHLGQHAHQPASQPLLTKVSAISTNLQLPTRHYTGFMLLISLSRRYIYGSFPSYIMRLAWPAIQLCLLYFAG